MSNCNRIITPLVIAVIGLGMAMPAAAAVDVDAAKALARQSNCFKCHGVEKGKDGPAWKDVSAKYRAKPGFDAEARLIEHITSGEKVKFKDGHEEEHTVVKSKDKAAIKNLVDWILSL
jgi:cytochrome c